jgi:penicillin-binding protein 1A
MLRRLLWLFLTLCFLSLVAAACLLFWGYHYITRDLPRLTRVEDYRPPAVSKVFAKDGTLVAEFYSDERRYPVKIKDVPQYVRNCFIASEDADFYRHPGIDPISILRAFYKNFTTGEARQGGSTITQQVVKNLLLTSEKSIERKVKEAILSYRLEKRFTKDEILELYLNQIFFGNGAYGIKAAAWVYYQKTPDQLTLAQAAVLAGLPQAPSKYSPLRNLGAAKRRQAYVLKQMLKAGVITREQMKEASESDLALKPSAAGNIFHSPYFVSEVRQVLLQRWKDLDIDRDGLEIHTTLDVEGDAIAQRALRKGLRDVDKRRGWRGPIGHIDKADQALFLKQYQDRIQESLVEGDVVPALVTLVSRAGAGARVSLGNQSALLDLSSSSWAKRSLDAQGRVSVRSFDDLIHVGDVIEVALKTQQKNKLEDKLPSSAPVAALPIEVTLDQTPDIEGALSIIDPHSGDVAALIGGYNYQRSVFNRATQSHRQPGSTFKPIIYLAAIDGFGYTPSTIVQDSPQTFRVGDQLWSPGNFDQEFLGPITLRTALEKSRNLVSADIVSRIGVDAVVKYAHKLGIESQIGRHLSISLGSSEVTLLELIRAYGVFPAKGVLFPSSFITRIIDRDGKVIFDHETERLAKTVQAINENSAFLMANLLRGAVEHGTGYKVKELGRPAAGKTGTSNDQMDAWFMGFTPDWACGVWVGFDQKKEIGEKETGGRVSAPIFVYAMKEFLALQDQRRYRKLAEETKQEAERLGIEYVAPAALEPLDFSVPEGVDPYWISKGSGLLSDAKVPGAFYEYFLKGTAPKTSSIEEADTNSYLESPEL